MRILNLFTALLGLILLSPLLIVIASLVKLTSPGPVFYRAKRVGRHGSIFCLYKFRTMRHGANKMGPAITRANDPRLTGLGRFLRQTKLDELPQLINVVKGDMALVGPRPEDPYYVQLYTPEQRQLLQVMPGITSAASLAYHHEEQLLTGSHWESTYRQQIMPAKLAIELNYLSCRTIWTDFGLILRTLAVIITYNR